MGGESRLQRTQKSQKKPKEIIPQTLNLQPTDCSYVNTSDINYQEEIDDLKKKIEEEKAVLYLTSSVK